MTNYVLGEGVGGVDSFSQTNNLEIGPELRWSTLTFADRLLCPAGLPWWFRRKESACQCRRWGFDPWVGKIRWRRKWQPTPVPLPGKSHGRRSLVATVHGVVKSQTRQWVSVLFHWSVYLSSHHYHTVLIIVALGIQLNLKPASWKSAYNFTVSPPHLLFHVCRFKSHVLYMDLWVDPCSSNFYFLRINCSSKSGSVNLQLCSYSRYLWPFVVFCEFV